MRGGLVRTKEVCVSQQMNGTGCLNLGDNLRGSVCEGRSWVKEQPVRQGLLTRQAGVRLSAAFL